jgi:fructokinase
MLVGFDIGGTKIEIRVINHVTGHELFVKRIPTPSNYEDLITQITQLVELAEKETGSVKSIGIGLPGAINPQTGLIQNANCTFLNDHDLKSDLAFSLNKVVNIANDANCFTLSEAVDGAGKEGSVVFGAILGTGCGGGIVINKQVLCGPNALAGEWGHNPLPSWNQEHDGDTISCYCGRNNCIERYISGSGLEENYRLLHNQSKSAPEIISAYMTGDVQAEASYNRMLDQMARSFATIINILDPDVIVLGGGLSNVDCLYRDLPDAAKPYIFSDNPKVTFKKAVYGDSSGVRGAAWLAK